MRFRTAPHVVCPNEVASRTYNCSVFHIGKLDLTDDYDVVVLVPLDWNVYPASHLQHLHISHRSGTYTTNWAEVMAALCYCGEKAKW